MFQNSAEKYYKVEKQHNAALHTRSCIFPMSPSYMRMNPNHRRNLPSKLDIHQLPLCAGGWSVFGGKIFFWIVWIYYSISLCKSRPELAHALKMDEFSWFLLQNRTYGILGCLLGLHTNAPDSSRGLQAASSTLVAVSNQTVMFLMKNTVKITPCGHVPY